MKNHRVNVIIASWNSRSFIYDALESLLRQTFTNFSITLIDNGSSDGTVEFVRQNYPHVYVLQNFKNTGFSKAYNQGIKIGSAEYILVMNHDVILDQERLGRLVAELDREPRAACAGPKVRRLFREHLDPEEKRGDMHRLIFSEIIDTAGLIIQRSREVKNRGEGEKDAGQYSKTQEVFGLSACVTLYRRSALEEIKIADEYFDEDFYAYKEDIDVAWRFLRCGWKNIFCPQAVAYHHRGFVQESERTPRAIARYRRTLSRRIRLLSFANQHYLLIKNDSFNDWAVDSWFIFWRELKVFAYALFFERFLLAEYVQVIKKIPLMLKKRHRIMARTKAPKKFIRRWLVK